MDQRFEQLDKLRSVLAVITYPIHVIAGSSSNLFIDWFNNICINQEYNYQQENRYLSNENTRLKGMILRLEALERENQYLRDQLSASLRVGEQVLLAELTEINLSPYRQQIWINKGSLSKVYVGQVVADTNGIMGQVTQVTPFYSKVLLITDPLHSIPVSILRTGLHTIAQGSGYINRLDLPYLPENADIQIGDLLISSGLGKRFPANYPVARIISIKRLKGSKNPNITVIPLAQLNQSKQVLLIL